MQGSRKTPKLLQSPTHVACMLALDWTLLCLLLNPTSSLPKKASVELTTVARMRATRPRPNNDGSCEDACMYSVLLQDASAKKKKGAAKPATKNGACSIQDLDVLT